MSCVSPQPQHCCLTPSFSVKENQSPGSSTYLRPCVPRIDALLLLHRASARRRYVLRQNLGFEFLPAAVDLHDGDRFHRNAVPSGKGDVTRHAREILGAGEAFPHGLRIGAHRALDCRHEQSGRVVTERPPPSGAVAIGPTISPGILPFLPRSRPNARILPIYGTRPSLRRGMGGLASRIARRLNRKCRRRSRRSHSHRARNDAMRTAGQDREGGRKPRLERAKTQGFAANRAGRALICHNSLVPPLSNIIRAGNASFCR